MMNVFILMTSTVSLYEEFYKHHVPFVTEWLAPALCCLFSTFMPSDVLASLQDTSQFVKPLMFQR